jgi:extracellular elastinolytic metalloproteinase
MASFTDEHAVGEVWCATLMEMNRQLGKALGSAEEGHLLGWQLVVDSFKLMPANPSFLDARDGILRALDDLKTRGRITAPEHQASRKAVWTAFAHFGMGVNASSNGAFLDGIQADESLPADLRDGAAAPATAPAALGAASNGDSPESLLQRVPAEKRPLVVAVLKALVGP